jgi:hypothetical protein
LPAGRDNLRQALSLAFAANEQRLDWPRLLVDQLVAEKYRRPEWNQRL